MLTSLLNFVYGLVLFCCQETKDYMAQLLLIVQSLRKWISELTWDCVQDGICNSDLLEIYPDWMRGILMPEGH